MTLNCGHVTACMFRHLHKGVQKKFCYACALDKLNMQQIMKEQTTLEEDLEPFIREIVKDELGKKAPVKKVEKKATK